VSIPHIVQFVLGNVWAIQPEKLQAILRLVLQHHMGARLSEEEVRAVVAAAPDRVSQAAGGAIGVLPLYGSIFPRANMITENSGGTSLQRFAAGFRGLMADSGVKAVVIDVDSPGGAVNGITEMCAEIMAARGGRPIVAVVNTLCGSAALALACACDEIVVSPSGLLGSIGCFYPHLDTSAAMAMAGEKVTLISAGDGKTDGNEFEPLTDEARAKIQKRVNEAYAIFVHDVSKGRGVSADTVRRGWKADVFGAQEAVTLGLADRVATLEETLARLASGSGRRASMRGDMLPAAIAEIPASPEYDGEAERRLIRARTTGL
jgi:signal peptide peptidase SppA